MASNDPDIQAQVQNMKEVLRERARRQLSQILELRWLHQ